MLQFMSTPASARPAVEPTHDRQDQPWGDASDASQGTGDQEGV